jgi:hypothetical protein
VPDTEPYARLVYAVAEHLQLVLDYGEARVSDPDGLSVLSAYSRVVESARELARRRYDDQPSGR